MKFCIVLGWDENEKLQMFFLWMHSFLLFVASNKYLIKNHVTVVKSPIKMHIMKSHVGAFIEPLDYNPVLLHTLPGIINNCCITLSQLENTFKQCTFHSQY